MAALCLLGLWLQHLLVCFVLFVLCVRAVAIVLDGCAGIKSIRATLQVKAEFFHSNTK